MKVPRTPLKKNPYAITNSITDALKVSKTASPPVCLSALHMYPPAPAPLTRINPVEAGHFIKPTKNKKTNTDSNYRRINNPKAAYKPQYVTRAPKIFYEEDSLRNTFYKSHPFELLNPIKVKQTEDELTVFQDFERSASSKEKTDNGKNLSINDFLFDGELEGESVIRYTTHLINSRNIEKPEAYRKSLSEFYYQKAKKEQLDAYKTKKAVDSKLAVIEERKILREIRIANGEDVEEGDENPEPPVRLAGDYKPWTNAFMKREMVELSESRKFNAEQIRLRNEDKLRMSKISEFNKK